LDTEILEWETLVAADKRQQPNKHTFHPRPKIN